LSLDDDRHVRFRRAGYAVDQPPCVDDDHVRRMGTVREKNTPDEEENRNSRSDYSPRPHGCCGLRQCHVVFEIRFWARDTWR
jgi:hypothetical protein